MGQHWSENDFVNMLRNHGTNGRGGVSIIDDFGVTNIMSDVTLSLDRLLNILDRVKSNYKPGIERVLTSLKNTSRNYIGAEFVLRYIEDIEVWNKIIGFEVDVQGGGRVSDILQNVKPFRIELKSWNTFENIYKPRTLQEFVRDLEGINALDEMQWVFDKKGSFIGAAGQSYLKNKILEMLQSAEGRAALGNISPSKAATLLDNRSLVTATSSQIEQAFIDFFNIESNFIKIFQ